MTVKQDLNGNVQLVKPERLKGSKRIDGMVALIMAMSRTMTDDNSRSLYSYQGLRWLET
jgi:phage terminase large subunit-like protein